MTFNVQRHLAEVERLVSSDEHDGQRVRSVILTRCFATTVEELWDVLTNSKRIPRWFLPISGDLVAGGRFQFEGNAGGLIEACEPQLRFAVTWEFGEHMSWVEVRCSRVAVGQARLTLTHAAPLTEHWHEYGPGATGIGWEMGLLGLALHLARPDAPKPDEAAFAASPDGKSFIVGSSEAWGEAAIAAGIESGVAQAAARRTTAFYTGD